MKAVLLLMMAMTVAVPVWAEDPVPTAPGTAPLAQGEAVTSDLDKVVCKRLPPPTGSRLGARRVCLTEREWRQERQESREFMRNQQEKSGGYRGPGG
jgi:hypothetical protein